MMERELKRQNIEKEMHERWAKSFDDGEYGQEEYHAVFGRYPKEFKQKAEEFKKLTELNSGYKSDNDKDQYSLLPVDSLREIVKVLTFGAKKYEPYNWAKGMYYSRIYSALQRHLNTWWGKEDNDPETKLSHLAHAGCCILFLLAYQLRGMTKWDDRP